jgi:hypothetical protein
MTDDPANSIAPSSGAETKYSSYPRPRCPVCHSVKIKTMHTHPREKDDESITRNVRCLEPGCGHRWILHLY